MNINKKYIYGFLTVIVVLLLAILLKENIKSYFRGREVLNRTNIFNLWDVAFDCYGFVNSDNPEATMSEKCRNTYNSYQDKTQKWDKLIKKYRDISCHDFADKGEAQDFYQYVNGEMAKGIYAYKTLHPEDESEIVGTTNIWDGNCRYDPYGLDTNGDCNACENLK